MPDEHDCESVFTFTLTFSEDVAGLSYVTLYAVRDRPVGIGSAPAGMLSLWTVQRRQQIQPRLASPFALDQSFGVDQGNAASKPGQRVRRSSL